MPLTLPRLPLARVLSGYRRSDLRPDVEAGITTAVMLIPQAMAYALLAGFPPVVGLYASVVPVALYAVFGTSRELAVGPVAMVSLLVLTGVGALTPAGSAEFVAYSILLAGMVGLLQLALGVMRGGFLVNFLSHPVIAGFTAAAALIIGFSQLKHVLGIEIARTHHIHEIAVSALKQMSVVNVPTLLLSAVAIALLVGLKRWMPRFPRALAVVAAGSFVVWMSDLASHGVAIVGSVPAGLPVPTIPTLDIAVMLDLLPIAITIALVAFLESISVAKAFARRQRYEVDSNQELVALGTANLGAALFGGYPVTGGFSRTAVNAQAGARTTVASLVTAGVVAVTLLFLTPLLFYLPKAVLAAIIVTAVAGFVDVAEAKHLYRVKRSDLVLMALTFTATLTLGIEIGIAAGVVASLLWFIVRKTRPHIAVLGRLPGTEIYRNVKRYPNAQTFPGLIIVRMDAAFYFGNVTFLRTALKQIEKKQADQLDTVILDASAMNDLDSSAEAALEELLDDYAERGITFLLAGVKGPVMDVLRSSGFQARMDGRFFFTVEQAVQWAEDRRKKCGGQRQHEAVARAR